MSKPFEVLEAQGNPVPIIVSVPHCGTEFPQELDGHYDPRQQRSIDDTDWDVDRLYSFVRSMGITVIRAKYHRWVIDLNRDPKSVPLYNDGRVITGLTPSTDFLGNPIYSGPSHIPNQEEIERRLDAYYWPYYQQIEALLAERTKTFGKVLLWDAHSIRSLVPSIRPDKFPDMILGNNDGKTAHSKLIATALEQLGSGDLQVNHNDPFKGGHITRYFGKPNQSVHALQLEMNKILYMDDRELLYAEDRASAMQALLKPTFEALIATIQTI
jgi:N-formylglutamate deformylase